MCSMGNVVSSARVAAILTATVWPPCRNGGGIGDASIRKMSYFEGSVDPAYAGKKASVYIYITRKYKG